MTANKQTFWEPGSQTGDFRAYTGPPSPVLPLQLGSLTEEPVLRSLSCVWRKKGNKVSIKLLLRTRGSE